MRLPHGCEGLCVRLMTVLWTFRRPFMGRPVSRPLLRNALRNLTLLCPPLLSTAEVTPRDTVGLCLSRGKIVPPPLEASEQKSFRGNLPDATKGQ